MKIICLIGKSASGKDTILNQVLKTSNIENIVSTTSRPIRSNEIEGKSYYFITKEVFLDKLNNGEFLEYTKYNVAVDNDIWYYGIDKTTLDNDKNYITIVNPDGYTQIQEKLGIENVIGVLITADDKERLIRSLTRDINVNIEEVIRRYQADEEDFKNIENEVKYIIKNRDLKQSVYILEKIIEKETKAILPEIDRYKDVIVTKILNEKEAGHLKEYVGKQGVVWNKNVFEDGEIRYKVLFPPYNDNETAYFRREEIKEV